MDDDAPTLKLNENENELKELRTFTDLVHSKNKASKLAFIVLVLTTYNLEHVARHGLRLAERVTLWKARSLYVYLQYRFAVFHDLCQRLVAISLNTQD